MVELMGHSRELGYVKTLYFGNQAMFEVTGPELPAREVMVCHGFYSAEMNQYIPAGSKIRKKAISARLRLVSAASVYAINPSDEQAIAGEVGGEGPVERVLDIPAEAAKDLEIPF